MEEVRKKTNWLQVASLAVIALLALEDGMLIVQNHQLRDQVTAPTAPRVEPLKPGEKVEPFKVQTIEGTTTEFEYYDSSKIYLLFVLSTTCPHCDRNLSNWESIVYRGSSETCDILGVSIDDLERTKEYAARRNVGFVTVSANVDTGFSRKYKIAGLPETILVDGRSIVQKIWMGELTPEQTNEIKSLISASRAFPNKLNR